MKVGISTDGDFFAEYYEATVVSANDYYPFGSAMAGRKYNQGTYRFGFNGKEEDSEWGSQMIQDYGFRIYNPTIGKFLSVDPLAKEYPFYTPYQFAGNKPVRFIDLDGLEERDPYEKSDDQAILEVIEFIAITVRDEIPIIGEIATYREEGSTAMIWGIIPFGRHFRKGYQKIRKFFKRKPKKAAITPDVKPDTSLEPPTKVEGNLNENSEITTYNVNTKTHKSDLEEVTVSSKRGEAEIDYVGTEDGVTVSADIEKVKASFEKNFEKIITKHPKTGKEGINYVVPTKDGKGTIYARTEKGKGTGKKYDNDRIITTKNDGNGWNKDYVPPGGNSNIKGNPTKNERREIGHTYLPKKE